MHDSTGRVARIYLSRLPAVWAGAIRRAALGQVAGECIRDWSHPRARAIVANALVLCRQGMKRGRTYRKGRWTHCVKGLTRGLFATVAQGARVRRPHRNTVRGVHRKGGDPLAGGQGYLDALRAAGLLYWQRLPASCVEPWERWNGRDGKKYASNRYWLCNPSEYDGNLKADAQGALLELARLATRVDDLRLRPHPTAKRAEPAAPPCESPPAPD